MKSLVISDVLTLILLLIISKNNGLIATDDKCIHTRSNKMLKAKCHGLNMKEVPQYISKDVEILDLSFNRIKKLNRTSFQRYTSVRYLILYENMIYTIEPGAFEGLDSLEEIDLSNNGLRTVPLEIFNLPSLRNVYLDSNELKDLEKDLIKLQKPIKAPLEYLNIADCGLQNIPDLGVLPKLWHLNVSSNPLTNISLDYFSSMCRLSNVDLSKTNMPKCSCAAIMVLCDIRHIKTHNHFCDTSINDATYCEEEIKNISSIIFNEEFERCKSMTMSVPKFRITWMFIALIISVGFIILISLVLCINHLKFKRRKKKLQILGKLQTTPLTTSSTPTQSSLARINVENRTVSNSTSNSNNNIIENSPRSNRSLTEENSQLTSNL